MIRSILILALAALTATTAVAQQGGPALKPAATVAGEIVHIGDLIDNAGAVADVPIFRAPDLGQTGSVPLASVLAAISGHHLLGIETHGLKEIAVTRAARTITGHDIEARILQVLAGNMACLIQAISQPCSTTRCARSRSRRARLRTSR